MKIGTTVGAPYVSFLILALRAVEFGYLFDYNCMISGDQIGAIILIGVLVLLLFFAVNYLIQ